MPVVVEVAVDPIRPAPEEIVVDLESSRLHRRRKAAQGTHRPDYYPDGTKDIFAWGNKGWSLDPPRLTATSDYATPLDADETVAELRIE